MTYWFINIIHNLFRLAANGVAVNPQPDIFDKLFFTKNKNNIINFKYPALKGCRVESPIKALAFIH